MDNLNKFIPLFLDGGWVVLIIGGAGMVARLATSKDPEDKTKTKIIGNIIAAMIASLIAWFILEQFSIPAMYKAIAYGLVGLNSPEILTGIIKMSTSFAQNPMEFIKQMKTMAKPSAKKKKIKKID